MVQKIIKFGKMRFIAKKKTPSSSTLPNIIPLPGKSMNHKYVFVNNS